MNNEKMDYTKNLNFLKFILNERAKGIENLNAKIADLERIKNILIKDMAEIEADMKEIENK